MYYKNVTMVLKKDSSYPNYYSGYVVGDSGSTESAERWGGSDAIKLEGLTNSFDGIKILGLDVRGNGGRAYRVAIKVNHYNVVVDLREDILLRIIDEVGILPKGIVNGQFSFYSNSSQIQLGFVNTEEDFEQYKSDVELIDNLQNKQLKNTIKLKDLKIGYSYQIVPKSKIETRRFYMYFGEYVDSEDNKIKPLILKGTDLSSDENQLRYLYQNFDVKIKSFYKEIDDFDAYNMQLNLPYRVIIKKLESTINILEDFSNGNIGEYPYYKTYDIANTLSDFIKYLKYVNPEGDYIFFDSNKLSEIKRLFDKLSRLQDSVLTNLRNVDNYVEDSYTQRQHLNLITTLEDFFNHVGYLNITIWLVWNRGVFSHLYFYT